MQSAFTGVTSTTATAQSNYQGMNLTKQNMIDSYSATYGASSAAIFHQKQSQANQRTTKKKAKVQQRQVSTQGNEIQFIKEPLSSASRYEGKVGDSGITFTY